HVELVDLVRFLSELGKAGPYQVGKERLVRRWQVLEAAREAHTALIRQGVESAAALGSWQTWSAAYTTAAGLLPLDEVPTFTIRHTLEQTMETVGLARCQLEVTTPGKVKLLLNSAEGLRLWLDGAPIESRKELNLDLKTGVHTLTLAVDREKRREPL